MGSTYVCLSGLLATPVDVSDFSRSQAVPVLCIHAFLAPTSLYIDHLNLFSRFPVRRQPRFLPPGLPARGLLLSDEVDASLLRHRRPRDLARRALHVLRGRVRATLLQLRMRRG